MMCNFNFKLTKLFQKVLEEDVSFVKKDYLYQMANLKNEILSSWPQPDRGGSGVQVISTTSLPTTETTREATTTTTSTLPPPTTTTTAPSTQTERSTLTEQLNYLYSRILSLSDQIAFLEGRICE